MPRQLRASARPLTADLSGLERIGESTHRTVYRHAIPLQQRDLAYLKAAGLGFEPREPVKAQRFSSPD